MNARRLLTSYALLLPIAGFYAHAQQHEPGTGSTQITPASKAPAPVQRPDVRLDSKPHTDIDPTVDSSITPMDPGLGASPVMDLGHDIVATTPAGMLSRSVPGNPRMVYFSLPQRTGDAITPGDRAIIMARQGDLAGAARGFSAVQDPGAYQQGVCPAMQPDAEAVVGVPAAGDGQGFILLHSPDAQGAGRKNAGYTAIVPRAAGLPVRASRAVPIEYKKKPHEAKAKLDRAMVMEALPPATLYGNLQPVQDWIAASACIAETAGAQPQIPNEPFLDEEITTAPEPTLRLMLSGERQVVFTDRLDDAHYVIWHEHVSRKGQMLDARYEPIVVAPRPVTNPPVPPTHAINNIPQPPRHVTPEPPSPLAGVKQ